MGLHFIAGALALAFLVQAAKAEDGADVCSLEAAAPVEIAAIDRDLDLLTAEGRRLALSGLEFPTDAPSREMARAFLADRLAPGRLAFLAPASAGSDRWGRLPAGLFVAGEDGEEPLVSLARAVLRAGLARFRPDPAAFACRDGLLAAETEARERRLGLWAKDEYVVVDAARRDRLMGRKGMVVVEGVVSGTGEAGGSIYLNFGPRRGADFAVVIRKRNLETFVRANRGPRMLTGRRVRVRGLIDTGSLPRMELLSPAQIELLGAGGAP